MAPNKVRMSVHAFETHRHKVVQATSITAKLTERELTCLHSSTSVTAPEPTGNSAVETTVDESARSSANPSAGDARSAVLSKAAAAPQSRPMAKAGSSRPAAKPPKAGLKAHRPVEPKPQQEDLRRRAVYQVALALEYSN